MGGKGLLLEKKVPLAESQADRVDVAIAHAEAALLACDELGLMMAAIDISSALDKLKSHRISAKNG